MIYPKNRNRKQRGQNGEMMAKKFLEEKGYLILAQNFRLPQKTGACEIDLVALNTMNMKLYLTEVKVRGAFEHAPTISFKQYKRIAVSVCIFRTFFTRPEALDEQSYSALFDLFEDFIEEGDFFLNGIETRLLKVNPEAGKVEDFKNLGSETGW